VEADEEAELLKMHETKRVDPTASCLCFMGNSVSAFSQRSCMVQDTRLKSTE